MRSVARKQPLVCLMHHAVLALFLIGLTAVTAAADLSRHEVHVPGSVQRVVAVDVDGSGKPELLVFSVSGDLNPQRHVSVFALESGRLSRDPRVSWVLDADAGVLDVGTDPQDGPSLWYCTADAVRRYRLRGSLDEAPAAETWFEVPSLLGGRSEEWTVFYDFVDAWRASGRETPAIFQPGRLLLPGPDPSKPPQVLQLRTEIDTTGVPASYEMQERLPLLLTQRIPAMTRVDADGDGRLDLIAMLGDRLSIYPGDENGTYATSPRTSLRFPSDADPRDETRRQFIELADVTGDGRSDAVLSTLTGGFGNLTHALAVFPGNASGFTTDPRKPLTKYGAASLTTLADLDGDRRFEIVTVTVKIGVRALLSYLLTSRVPIEYAVYRVDGNGEIAAEPMLEWTRRVELQTTGATDPGVVTLAGDFDGDGIRDVVSAADDDEIEIRRVTRKGDDLSLGDVITEVNAPGRGQALAPDLDGDGLSDLVIYAPRRDEGIVTVFLSATAAQPPVIRPAPQDVSQP